MAAKAKKQTEKLKESVARQDDGTIQITLTLPWNELEKEMESQAIEMGKTIEVAGFRKGMAPLDQILKRIPRENLVEKTLQKILPKRFGEVINKNKIRPAMYPKFEIVKAEEDKDWQIRATTCEIGEVKLGEYKKAIQGALRAKAIWTPDNSKDDEKKELSGEEKEQLVLGELLKSVKLTLPGVLIDQEVDSRLAALLERLEKLGLSLESYLASINKKAEDLREEYRKQAEDSIKLELILNRIAQEEGIEVTGDEIEKFVEAARGDSGLAKKLEDPEQKRLVAMILRKRKVLESLTGLG